MKGNVGKQKQLIPERPGGFSPAVSASAKLLWLCLRRRNVHL
jgi:hypothetical protein